MSIHRFALLILLTSLRAHAAVFTLQAGAISPDRQWLFLSVYPLTGLNPPFAIAAGDAIVFVCEGSEKAIVITNRPYVPLLTPVGDLDATLSASWTSPLVVVQQNATYSSGLLSPGENFTFVFPVAGLWPLFDPVSSLALGVVEVVSAGAPYTPEQVAVFTADQIARDYALATGSLYAASDVSQLQVGSILLSWSDNSSRYSLLRALSALTSFRGSTSLYAPETASLVVYKRRVVTIFNRDRRP